MARKHCHSYFIVCEKENNIIAISNDVETVVCLSLSRQFARFKLNISISIEILFVHFSVYLQSKKKINNIKVADEEEKIVT